MAYDTRGKLENNIAIFQALMQQPMEIPQDVILDVAKRHNLNIYLPSDMPKILAKCLGEYVEVIYQEFDN